jgi:hypothetical protein
MPKNPKKPEKKATFISTPHRKGRHGVRIPFRGIFSDKFPDVETAEGLKMLFQG